MANKFLFFSVVTTLLFAACQSPNNGEEKATQNDVKNPAAQSHDHGSNVTLSLNNGAKWHADSITNANVGSLIALADQNNPVSLQDYQTLAKSLEGGINKLISDCRMNGPDHEALHQWLEPLLTMNKEFTEASSVESAAEIFVKEKEHLHLFHQYFE